MKHVLLLSLFVALLTGQEKKSFSEAFIEQSNETEKIARKYFQHYLDTNIDKMGEYLTEKSSWFDPTAEGVFRTKLLKGKKQIVERLSKTYKNIDQMKVDTQREIFTGRFAIFEVVINYTWAAPNSKSRSYSLPAVFMLKIENGKIIEHRDYADYTVWIEQNKKYRSN